MTSADRAAAGAARIDRAVLAAGRCPCDPTRGMSCRYCDGTDADEREARREAWRAARPHRTTAPATTDDEAQMLQEAHR